MHIFSRFRSVVAIGLVLVPLGLCTMIVTRDGDGVGLRMHSAAGETQETKAVPYGAKELTTAQHRVVDLGKRKREARLKLARLLTVGPLANAEAKKLLTVQEQTAKSLKSERDRLVEFLRMADARSVPVASGEGIAKLVAGQLFLGSMSDALAADMRTDALVSAREQLLLSLAAAEDADKVSMARLHAAAGSAADDIVEARQELGTLRDEYMSAIRTVGGDGDENWRTLSLSDSQLDQVRNEQAQVESEVTRAQDELNRIDARLRRKAERSLVEKGLIDPVTGEHSDGRVVGAGQFMWPVYSRVSAGFHDPDYLRIFGVQHRGVDLPTAQGTPVRASADGVVITVRDGGLTGYTYVLIGHVDGYATLYGHLSMTAVMPGEEVKQGDVIGLSGGLPGTHGAGPMTTGAHLHFEVMRNGANIDPLLVLPK